MGTDGYRHAGELTYRDDEVILEVGTGDGVSTRYLATLGPRVVTIDVERSSYDQAVGITNVDAHLGYAEDVLRYWQRPIGFAWLDGHDWPYTGNPPDYYRDQRRSYEVRGRELSQRRSRRSHLDVTVLIADHARVIAFDDTWRTHDYQQVKSIDDPAFTLHHVHDGCTVPVPPATTPAPALAMDQPIERPYCGLEKDHPHHDDPGLGWNGKGGEAIPYLLARGFGVHTYGLGLVVLRRLDDLSW